ncbi:MAG: hypothetical protein PHX31_08485, partial [Syntrophaceticus schinkii]|nr:hypothetical protein [Syntrophaceticus schinkii]
QIMNQGTVLLFHSGGKTIPFPTTNHRLTTKKSRPCSKKLQGRDSRGSTLLGTVLRPLSFMQALLPQLIYTGVSSCGSEAPSPPGSTGSHYPRLPEAKPKVVTLLHHHLLSFNLSIR